MENLKGRNILFMRNIKITADSSANVLQLEGFDFAAAPLKIIAGEKEFVDDHALDVSGMVRWFDSYKEKSKTSCPNPGDWLDAFGDADEVFCVTITSGLSGSYNSACVAKQMYEAEHPGKKVCVIDSLSAGPELVLIIEKLQELIAQGLSFEEISEQIKSYQQQTGLVFMLESLKNFAANGRVPMAVAKLAGVLGIRIVGKASDQGTLQPMDKSRGEAKALKKLLEYLKNDGLSRGKVRIAHCTNQTGAENLMAMIREEFPEVDVSVSQCLGLCSYYAEKGGLLVGFERF
jgi:DegV family protein with EDD domain